MALESPQPGPRWATVQALPAQRAWLRIPGTFRLKGKNGRLCFTWSWAVWSVVGAGSHTLLPVGYSKDSNGNTAEGKRRGLLGSWVGMPRPFLFLSGPL